MRKGWRVRENMREWRVRVKGGGVKGKKEDIRDGWRILGKGRGSKEGMEGPRKGWRAGGRG